jgi:hypothetical protein
MNSQFERLDMLDLLRNNLQQYQRDEYKRTGRCRRTNRSRGMQREAWTLHSPEMTQTRPKELRLFYLRRIERDEV